MKLTIDTLRGYTLHAQDGEIGKIKDLLFDDHQWGGRWLVADTRSWLPGRKVLLSPISFENPNPEEKSIPVRMTQQEIQDSPPLEEDAPVSLQYEKTFYDQYFWPYYWTGGGLWANQTYPIHLDPDRNKFQIDSDAEPDPEHRDHVLRSADELMNYRITVGRVLEQDAIASVSDLVIDTETWAVPYLILRKGNLLSAKKIMVPRERVIRTQWKERSIHMDLDEKNLDEAPEFEGRELISDETEKRTTDFFGNGS